MNAWGPELNSWGVALAWSAVQVGVFLIVGALAYLSMRRRNPVAGAWALSAVLIAAIGLWAITLSPWPQWGSVDGVWQYAVRVAAPHWQPDDSAARSNPLAAAEPTIDSDASIATKELPGPNVEAEAAAWRQRWRDLQDELSRSEKAGSWRWPAWLAAIVLGCIVLGIARLGAALVLAQRFGGRAARVDLPEMQSLLKEIQLRLGCSRRVEVRESKLLGSPCTLGWSRPMVVLPADWRMWTPGELRSVMAHELAHVARGDFAVGLLAQVGAVLHFYNPLVWWLLGRLRLEQEMAADLFGAKLAGGRQIYLATIARMALRQSNLPLMARPFLPTRGTLLRRVEMLHRETRLPEGSISWSGRMVVAMLLLLAGGLLAGVRGPSDGSAKAASPLAKEAEPVTTDERKLLVGASKEYQSAYNRVGFLRRDLRDALKRRRDNKESLTPETEQAVSEARQKVLQAELALAEMESDLRLDGEEDQSKRHAAARQVYLRNASAEKLKSLWVALNNYVDIHRHFPLPVEMGPDGKTPHSWRVSLLRFLDDDLYERYRLNEPWDSEHNRQLIAAGADLFSVPAESPSADCGYFAIVGPGFMFDPAGATGYRDVKDGTAQTIAIVEAKRSIPWTKPEDVELTNDGTLSNPGGHFPGGFHALFLNGNIHFLSDDLDPAVVKALATLAAGEELTLDRATNRLKLKTVAASSDEVSKASSTQTAAAQTADANREAWKESMQRLDVIRRKYASPKLFGKQRVPGEENFKARRELRQAELAQVDAESDAHPHPLWKDLSPAERHAAARNAYLRQSSIEQLKHLGIAFHSFHDVHKRFPVAVELGPDGKTPHSWRVALLPYLPGNGEELYKRYRMDEPWDSEHNKQIIAEGAHFYSVPGEDPSNESGYFVFAGPGTVFDPAAPASTVHSITDGISYTLGVVEANRTVPWTKPEDIPYEPSEPLPKLGGNFEGGFNTMFMDGSVQFLPNDIEPPVLRALISKAGREVLGRDPKTDRFKVGK